MDEVRLIRSRTFNLPAENIDTDQIYPARYLTTTSQQGLGEYCFYDWRHNEGSRFFSYFRTFNPGQQQVLVAGNNFGCGSSREHAAWSLLDMGFKAVISTRFGDIFHSNALKNGLLLVEVDAPTLEWLMAHPGHEVSIDVESTRLEIPGFGTFDFPLDAFSAHCLTRGMDSLDFLLEQAERINEFERKRAL